MVKGDEKLFVSGQLHAASVIFRARMMIRSGLPTGNKKPRRKPGQMVGSFMNNQPVTVMFTALGPLPRRSGSVS